MTRAAKKKHLAGVEMKLKAAQRKKEAQETRATAADQDSREMMRAMWDLQAELEQLRKRTSELENELDDANSRAEKYKVKLKLANDECMQTQTELQRQKQADNKFNYRVVAKPMPYARNIDY